MSYQSKTFKRPGWTLEVEIGCCDPDEGGSTQAYLTQDKTGASASLECALATGCVDRDGEDVEVAQSVLDWAEKTATNFGY